MPKPDAEQDPNSLQFCEGRKRGGSCRRKVQSQQRWVHEIEERNHLCNRKVQGEAVSANVEAAATIQVRTLHQQKDYD